MKSAAFDQVKELSPEMWNNRVRRTDNWLFFHTHEWANVWETTWPENYRAVCYEFTTKNQSTILLPGVERALARGFRREFLSAPGGCAAGALNTDGTATEDDHEQVASYLNTRYHSWEIRVLKPDITISENSLYDTTYLIDLKSYDFDYQLTKTRAGRYARNAGNRGLNLEMHISDPDIFVQFYHKMMLEWKQRGIAISTYPDHFFYALHKQKGVHLLGVRDEYGTIVAAGFFLESNTHVVSWLTLADPDKRHLHALEYLYFSLFKHYDELGFRYFDFNPSRSLEGVELFKKKFGATSCPIQVISQQDMITRAIKKLNRLMV